MKTLKQHEKFAVDALTEIAYLLRENLPNEHYACVIAHIIECRVSQYRESKSPLTMCLLRGEMMGIQCAKDIACLQYFAAAAEYAAWFALNPGEMQLQSYENAMSCANAYIAKPPTPVCSPANTSESD